MIDLKKLLNDKQYEAASNITGPSLIIAGAGSGKTRMLTYKIAYMILNCKIDPKNILALTFTNDAAKEMQERINKIVGKVLKDLTVSTFHSFGVKVLRENSQALGYSPKFSIYDSQDSISAIKDAARECNIPVEAMNMIEITSTISALKTEREEWTPANINYKELFDTYNHRLKAYNAFDFDDLIMKPIELFENNEDILSNYQNKYKYILVDEFQDTSLSQFKIVKLLADKHRNICVVGDDDQSIYSWRGADYRNIQNFEKYFPELKEIKLEQNYRSTKNILEAANKVIEHNVNRKIKNLWTGDSQGKNIELYLPETDIKEAEFIASTIRSLKYLSKCKYSDFGVLVRTNTLCTTIEEFFIHDNIPYSISGGSSFFSRKEIKDVISFIKICINKDDDISLLRVINVPRRGIGIKSVEKLRAIAQASRCSIFSAMCLIKESKDGKNYFSDSMLAEIAEFVDIINNYSEIFEKQKYPSDFVDKLLQEIDYNSAIFQDNKDNDKLIKFKLRNVSTFIKMIKRWEQDEDNENQYINNYINIITLLTGEDKNKDNTDKVNLMTIHASKGLEFEIVFIAGVEDEIIPHKRAIDENPENIQEERRLFYVAITRAKKHLILTSCQKRKTLKTYSTCRISPFIKEIPENLIKYHDEKEYTKDFDPTTFLNSLKI